MKQLLIFLLLVVTLLAPASMLAGRATVVAAPAGIGVCSGTAKNTDVCHDVSSQSGSNDPIIKIIKVAINILSFIIGIISVITIVVSGVRMIFSGGVSQAVASARTGLIYAIAGLAVTALAQAIVAFVLDKIG
jgi:hypothetical protein